MGIDLFRNPNIANEKWYMQNKLFLVILKIWGYILYNLLFINKLNAVGFIMYNMRQIKKLE